MTDTPTPDTLFGHWRRLARRGALVALVLAASLGAYLGLEQLSGNFHTVVAGELYRSAQPTPERLAYYQQHYGIRTVINLRGASDRDWYRDEIAASRALGLDHVDVRLLSAREIDDAQAQELIAVMAKAEKPILIHCQSGADRSGIAAALYVAGVARQSEEAAEAQLSILYGHIALPFARAWPMDETFERLEPWLGFPDS